MKYKESTLLMDTSIRRTPGVNPCVFQSFYCNYTLYKTGTSLRQTADTFETVNGRLESALCSEKYLKTENNVGTLHDSKLQKEYFVVLLQIAECILLHF